jgi:hypothetical protein
MATGWADGLDSRHCKVFLLHIVQTDFVAHSVSCPVGTGSSSLGVKRQEHEAFRSPSTSAEVKKGGAVP